MLTREPGPDHTRELNITSFLTLPHPLHCSICATNMVTVLLLQVMGGWVGWGGSCMLGFGCKDRGWVSYFFYFLFCFCAVANCSFMAGS